MPAGSTSFTVSDAHAELQRLRRGHGFSRPATFLTFSPTLAACLTGEEEVTSTPDGAATLRAGLERAIAQLSPAERTHALVELGLTPNHAYSTLTERQESLARELGCTSKTVRRHGDRALESLAIAILSAAHHQPHHLAPAEDDAAEATAQLDERPTPGRLPTFWSLVAYGRVDTLCDFWGLSPGGRVDIVCSEIPEDERPSFASPDDRNYLRYAKFADLDTLIFTRTQIAQLQPNLTTRDFSPSEYYDSETDVLIVIGGPPWNGKYRQFLPQLPFHFEPHPLGEDDPLVVPSLGLKLGPHWTPGDELVEDLAVFTRLTLAHGPKVFLFGGCLTLGVLGAASLFLRGDHGARNTVWLTELAGGRDVVVVTEARRVGGIADLPELSTTEPLLVLARDDDRSFTPLVDNTKRYGGS